MQRFVTEVCFKIASLKHLQLHKSNEKHPKLKITMKSIYKIIIVDDKWWSALQINFYPKQMKNQNQSQKAWRRTFESEYHVGL